MTTPDADDVIHAFTEAWDKAFAAALTLARALPDATPDELRDASDRLCAAELDAFRRGGRDG